MRPGIKFHDGSQLTAHDVAFSLKILKDKGHPTAQQLLRDFGGAEATDNATVVLRFAPKRAAPPTAKFNKIIPQAAMVLTRQESSMNGWKNVSPRRQACDVLNRLLASMKPLENCRHYADFDRSSVGTLTRSRLLQLLASRRILPYTARRGREPSERNS
jgi:hypothetical protein